MVKTKFLIIYILFLLVFIFTDGNYEIFMVEFRGKDNLRLNQDLNIDELNIIVENDLLGIEVFKRNGNRKGQFIVDIKKNKTFNFYENFKFLIFYENNETMIGIQIVVKLTILHHFSVDLLIYQREIIENKELLEIQQRLI